MTRVQPLPPGQPIASIRCGDCAKPMLLTSIEPHDRFTNLLVRHFICTCGAGVSDQFRVDESVNESPCRSGE
jgi:hypothetical protein